MPANAPGATLAANGDPDDEARRMVDDRLAVLETGGDADQPAIGRAGAAGRKVEPRALAPAVQSGP